MKMFSSLHTAVDLKFDAAHVQRISARLQEWGRDHLPYALQVADGRPARRAWYRDLEPYLQAPRLPEPLRKRYEQRALRHIKLRQNHALHGMTALAIAHRLPASSLWERFKDGWVVWSGQWPRLYMPMALWHVAGTMAWSEPAFQHWVATLLQDYLRQRELFALDVRSIPCLHPNTFWLLLALFNASPLLTRSEKRLTSRSEQAARRLSQIAQHAALQPGWAAFWEQWVVAETLSLEPYLRGELGALRRSIAALPLLDTPRYRELQEALTPSPSGQGANRSRSASTAKKPSNDQPVALAPSDWDRALPMWVTRTTSTQTEQG